MKSIRTVPEMNVKKGKKAREATSVQIKQGVAEKHERV
jgi:hypothetical protein